MVIAVLAGLLGLLVPNFMQVRIKSRDGRRKTDLRSIQKALELYKINQTNPEYPTNGTFTACTTFSASGVDYMKKIPQDPLSNCGSSPVDYYYAIDGSDPGKYTLAACLENGSDSEGVSCPSDFQTKTGSACTSTKCYQLNEP